MSERPKVLVTSRIPDEGMCMLEEHCEVKVFDYEGVFPRDVLLREAKGVDAIVCLLADKIDGEVMDAAGSQLRVVANYAVGYDNIDVDAATKRGIMVTNTPGVLTDTTADLAWALLLATARRIVEGDKFLRQGKFKGWKPMLLLGTDVHHATLGIIGFGNIGRAVARRAMGFDMKIIYYSAHKAPVELERKLNVEYRPLDDLLKEADFVSIHVPLTKETRHLIGERELRMMKKEAYLINTARGPIVDEKALAKALKEGWIRGAGLDVFEREPEVEPELLELDNVVLLPHLGSASYATRAKMATMAAENALKALKGEVPPNLVNPEVVMGR
ncbi:MAG: glyoxylate reductase [Acetomicrobium sp.]